MKYRKKPVIIQAEQYSVLRGLNTKFLKTAVCDKAHDGYKGEPHIHTLEGLHSVTDGDFIIRGIKGEYYPCKPDIFAKTYEPIKGKKDEVFCLGCEYPLLHPYPFGKMTLYACLNPLCKRAGLLCVGYATTGKAIPDPFEN